MSRSYIRGDAAALVRRLRDQRGLTIAELLMAAFIGLVVLGMVFAAVAVQGRGAAVQSGLADAQLASRGAGELLFQDLRMAGYGMLGVNPNEDVPPLATSTQSGVFTLTLRGAYSNTRTTLANSHAAGLSQITVTPPLEGAFKVGNEVLIDSGLNSEVKTITTLGTQDGNLTIGLDSVLQHPYPLGPMVTQLEIVNYTHDGTLLRRNGAVLADNATAFQVQYVDQGGTVSSEPGDDLRAVLLDLVAAQAKKLPGNPNTKASIDTEVNVRNLAYRLTLN